MLGIRRREFITLLGGAAAWPLEARAQQGTRVRRIGVLMPLDENDPPAKTELSAFTQALAGLGWTDGRNVRMDLRWAGGDINRIRATENNRDARSCGLRRKEGPSPARRDYDGYLKADEIDGQLPHYWLTVPPAEFDGDVLALDISSCSEAPSEIKYHVPVGFERVGT